MLRAREGVYPSQRAGLVIHPSGRPIIHSVKQWESCGLPWFDRIVGAGAARPVMCSHRLMAGV